MLLAVDPFIRESWRKSRKDTLQDFLWKAHILHHFPPREDREVDKMLCVPHYHRIHIPLLYMFQITIFLDKG